MSAPTPSPTNRRTGGWWFATILVVLGIVGLLAAQAVRMSLDRQAVLAQLVIPDTTDADLFGGPPNHTPIGSPQRFVVTDSKAFLEGTTENGARLLSDTYLKEHGIYPLQFQTVEFATRMASIASATIAIFGIFVLVWISRRARPIA